MKMIPIDQIKNKDSQHLVRMMHHLALNGMENITVVHMMLCLQFYSVYGYQSPRSGEKYSRIPTNIFLHCMMDFKNIWVVYVILKLDVTLFIYFCVIMTLFPLGHRGCSVSALATQIFYLVFKVPQLHLKCSHCNHTIIINSYHVSRVMHVQLGKWLNITNTRKSHVPPITTSLWQLYCSIRNQDTF